MLTKGLTLHSYWKWVDWNPIYTIWKGGVCIRRDFSQAKIRCFFFVVVHLDPPRKFKTYTKKDWCCVLILTSFFRRVFYIFWIYPPTQDTSATWRFWLGSRTLLFFCHPGGDCCWFGGRFKAYWWTGLKRMKSKYVLNGSRHVENGWTTN